MPIAEARVETERPSRYLVQLCRHFDNKGRHLTGHRPRRHEGGDVPRDTPPDQIHVEWSETEGMVRLPWGRCTMRAVPGTLVLRAEADDDEGLHRIQALLTSHLGRFGRRDELKVGWLPPEPTTEPTVPTRNTHTPPTPPRRSKRAWAGIALLGALVVAAHIGLGGAALAVPGWTGWVVGAVLVIVLVKVAAVIALGRHAVRRGHRRTG